jgi:CBS domain-containing membrane protein
MAAIRPHLRIFRNPLLAGASFRDRGVACLGALVGIALTAALSSLLGISAETLPAMVAPMGASAVLLFAVPASPLAQPWPIVGGNLISAVVGVTVARFVPDLWIAAGVAVAAAILVMSVLRCLHPPGGASALLAVLGGHAVQSEGYLFAFAPVGLNSLLLVGAGWLFHRVSGHSYPHRRCRSSDTK